MPLTDCIYSEANVFDVRWAHLCFRGCLHEILKAQACLCPHNIDQAVLHVRCLKLVCACMISYGCVACFRRLLATAQSHASSFETRGRGSAGAPLVTQMPYQDPSVCAAQEMDREASYHRGKLHHLMMRLKGKRNKLADA